MNATNTTLTNLTLSDTSKMPCKSWSVTALACNVGSKLAQVEGSICHGCYALKGFYRMPNVASTLHNRIALMKERNWWFAMVCKIRDEEKSGFFRWFDSGDLQSLKNLKDIVRIALALPEIRFWLPTKEYAIVSEYYELYGPFPPNLTVRLSAYMVDKNGPDSLAQNIGVTTSEVCSSLSQVSESKTVCPSSTQGNKCLDCRACWSQDVPTVVYRLH
jgi:hypothetical protein